MNALKLPEIAEAGSSTSSKWVELGGEILGFGREIAKIRTESRPILGVGDVHLGRGRFEVAIRGHRKFDI